MIRSRAARHVPPAYIDQIERVRVPIDRIAAHRIFLGEFRRAGPVHKRLLDLIGGICLFLVVSRCVRYRTLSWQWIVQVTPL